MNNNFCSNCFEIIIFLPSTVSLTFVRTNVYWPLLLALIRKIFFVPSNLNKLKVLSTCHKEISIDNAQNVQFRICWMELFKSNNHCITVSLIEVPPLKGAVDLILKVQNTLPIDSVTTKSSSSFNQIFSCSYENNYWCLCYLYHVLSCHSKLTDWLTSNGEQVWLASSNVS